MDNLEIITLSQDQWGEYKNLRLKALKDNPEAFGEVYDQIILRTDDAWKMMLNVSDDGRKRWVFFAKLNGVLVGMVSGQAMESVEGGIKVREMFVSKEARRNGIARKLIQALENELIKNTNRKVLRIGVFKIQTEAINLYKKLGFEILEEKTEVLSGGISHESLIMQKKLR